MEPVSAGNEPGASNSNSGWWIALGGAVAVAFLLDLTFLHWKVLTAPSPAQPVEVDRVLTETPLPAQETASNICPNACLSIIRDATAAAVQESESQPPVVVQQTPAQTRQQGEFFIPIGSGSTGKREWTEIPGAEVAIDTANYPGKRTVTWEAALSVLSGNGRAYARLKNKTTGVWVAGTEMNASADPAVQIVSGPFELAEGKHTYRVEMYTTTGYTATLESGRMKIVLE